MKLGILVNTNNYPDAVIGLVKSAVSKEHEVTLFIMDDGARLLEDRSFCSLSDLDRVYMSYCDHSVKELGVKTDKVPEAIESSSQYNNAVMNHNMDKVIVL